MPPTQCPLLPHHGSGERYPIAGQPEERLKGVCVHQEANGDAFNCIVKALVCRVFHLRKNGGDNKALLSAFYLNGIHYDVTREDISKWLKMAAMLLHYRAMRGIAIERIDMYSLCSGGTTALTLSGYSNTQIQNGKVEGCNIQGIY